MNQENKNIAYPQISKQLILIDDFSAYAHDFMDEEALISEVKVCEEHIESGDFYKIEIQKSIFENCIFNNCKFEKSSFVDVIFQSCDLSNSIFTEAYFERCRFISCKCIGIDMNDTVVKQTIFEHLNLQFSYFNKTKMTDVLFDHVDFTESSMIEAKLQRFDAVDSIFVKNNFFKTMLAAVDFTRNEFIAPIVSMPPVELKGAVVNMLQAADLISLWGVVVRR